MPSGPALHLASAKARDLLPRGLTVSIEERAPTAVADLCGALGRVDNVGEQHRGQRPVRLRLVTRLGQEFLDLVDDAIGDAAIIEGPMVGPGVLRSRNPGGELASGLDRYGGVGGQKDYQCRQ